MTKKAVANTSCVLSEVQPLSHIAAGEPDAIRPLRISGLTKEYVAGKKVLDGIDLEVGDTGITAIIGPSGTGKSTLVRCINRLVEPTNGEVIFGNQNIVGLSYAELRRVRRKIGMIFQEYNLVERLSVMENLLCGRLGYTSVFNAWLRRFPQEEINRAFDLLDRVGLTEFATRRADALSGGQRQRVGIARALMQKPELILADEPTSSLDPKTSVEIMELIGQLAGERKIPVIVNIHDVALAQRFADRIIGMSAGRIVFDGLPSSLSDNDLSTIYGGEDWL